MTLLSFNRHQVTALLDARQAAAELGRQDGVHRAFAEPREDVHEPDANQQSHDAPNPSKRMNRLSTPTSLPGMWAQLHTRIALPRTASGQGAAIACRADGVLQREKLRVRPR